MIPARFNRSDVDVQHTEEAFRGFFRVYKLTLRHRQFDGQWGPVIERELFAKGEAAAAVLYDPVNDLIGLVEQFRVGMINSPEGAWSLEFVAGMMEEGDSSGEAMLRRELVEEAGVFEAELLPITSFYPLPGSCSEYTHLYCALADLSEAGGRFGLAEEGEDIYFHVLPAEQVLADMLGSRTNNAATLVGLMWLQIHRDRLRTAARPRDDNPNR